MDPPVSAVALKGVALLPLRTGYVSFVSGATLLPGFRPHFAEIDGVRTRWFAAGAGPPLVLVHGLGGAAVNFTELAPLLARRHRVIVPDLPGHGRSAPFGREADIGDYAAHVAAVAEREDAFPAPVLGYSMGALVALRLAVARPEDVTSLILVAAAGIVSATRRAEAFFTLTGLLQPARFMARFRTHFAARPRLRRLPFGYWGAVHPPALSPETVLGFLEGPSQHADVAAAGRALVRDDPRPDLDRVTCPALLVWGARDRLVPLEDGFEYARRLRAPIRTLPAAGHLVVGEQPAAVARLIGEFLDGVGQVDELPFDAELLGELRRQGADA
jgi:pimeloyl-ACP methyl ester carboxylesterase